MKDIVKSEKTYWHPAFFGATKWELKENKDDLFFDSEYQLSQQALEMDLLVIKKDPSVVVKNEIGKNRNRKKYSNEIKFNIHHISSPQGTETCAFPGS